MFRRHPVIQLSTPSWQPVIKSYLGLVLTAPCHCLELPRTCPWEAANLLGDRTQFCAALTRVPLDRVLAKQNRSALGTLRSPSVPLCSLPELLCPGLSLVCGRPRDLPLSFPGHKPMVSPNRSGIEGKERRLEAFACFPFQLAGERRCLPESLWVLPGGYDCWVLCGEEPAVSGAAGELL